MLAELGSQALTAKMEGLAQLLLVAVFLGAPLIKRILEAVRDDARKRGGSPPPGPPKARGNAPNAQGKPMPEDMSWEALLRGEIPAEPPPAPVPARFDLPPEPLSPEPEAHRDLVPHDVLAHVPSESELEAELLPGPRANVGDDLFGGTRELSADHAPSLGSLQPLQSAPRRTSKRRAARSYSRAVVWAEVLGTPLAFRRQDSDPTTPRWTTG